MVAVLTIAALGTGSTSVGTIVVTAVCKACNTRTIVQNHSQAVLRGNQSVQIFFGMRLSIPL